MMGSEPSTGEEEGPELSSLPPPCEDRRGESLEEGSLQEQELLAP